MIYVSCKIIFINTMALQNAHEEKLRKLVKNIRTAPFRTRINVLLEINKYPHLDMLFLMEDLDVINEDPVLRLWFDRYQNRENDTEDPHWLCYFFTYHYIIESGTMTVNGKTVVYDSEDLEDEYGDYIIPAAWL